MKRLTVFMSALVLLAVGSSALAAGGPGKLKTKITGSGAKTEHGQLDGTWTIDLKSPTSGKVNLTWNGKPTGGGTYSIQGSTITLTPKGNGSCTTQGKYRMKTSGNQVTFKLISDSCSVRRDVLTYGPWTKVH